MRNEPTAEASQADRLTHAEAVTVGFDPADSRIPAFAFHIGYGPFRYAAVVLAILHFLGGVYLTASGNWQGIAMLLLCAAVVGLLVKDARTKARMEAWLQEGR